MILGLSYMSDYTQIEFFFYFLHPQSDSVMKVLVVLALAVFSGE